MQIFLLFFLPAGLFASMEIHTKLGTVRGSTMTSMLGKTIYAFRGLRYAEAPVGNLRFQPPVPIKSWSGTYDATKDAAVCPQPDTDLMSEDCLFLNVYTTLPPSSLPKSNITFPVFVYIHAGGFYGDSGRSDWIGPEYMMDQEVVLVTMNYRLGSLGFISTGDKLAPGNLGLKDQVEALKWIQQNIRSFGGDPNSVTVYGYSMGGASISLHMLSPMSRGLFHKAILGSGSNYGNWPVPRHQFELAQKQARLVGCPDDTSERIMACLKNVSAKALAESLDGFNEFGYQPILTWLPVIEPDFGQERFLSEHPVDMVKAGKLAKMPVITGVTKDEFAGSALYIARNETLVEQLDKESDKNFPICFIYERDTNRSKVITADLKKFYFGNKRIGNGTLDSLVQIFADGIIGYGVNIGAKLISKYSSNPVYYYRFSYQGRYSHFYLPGTNNTVPYGVVHHDDLLYVFRLDYIRSFNESYPESKMVETLTSIFARFALTGNPNSPNSTLWKEFNLDTNYYLDIGNQLELKQNLYKDRYDEWEKLFSIL